MSNLPQTIIDMMNADDPDWRDYNPRFERISTKDLIFEGKLVITYEDWDWTESLHICDTHNLKVVFEADLLGGPGVKLCEKVIADQPGFVLLRSDNQYFYIEW